MQTIQEILHSLFRNSLVGLFLLFVPLCCAQSQDASSPTPVTRNDIAGTIAARDLGDSRLTNYYYILAGTNGDLVITVDTRNLNGDIDVFTVQALKPLTKFVVYAENSSPVSKSIFVRSRAELILRIQARTPNDDPGTYHISFGGSFEPLAALPATDAAVATQTETSQRPPSKKGRRVSSSGARINATTPEVAVAPTPEPTAEAPPTTEAPAESTKPAASNSRRSRTRRGSRKPTTTAPATSEGAAKTNSEAGDVTKPTSEGEPAETATGTKPEENPTPSRTRASRKNRKPPASSSGNQSASQPTEPNTGPRLIIQTFDGTLIERPMAQVRRFTIEDGEVVIVARGGQTTRIRLSLIMRILIAP